MAAVMHGKVDQIIFTGGIAYGKETIDAISEMVSWIAPIVYPGEDVAGPGPCWRVLKGEEKAQEYRRPVPRTTTKSPIYRLPWRPPGGFSVCPHKRRPFGCPFQAVEKRRLAAKNPGGSGDFRSVKPILRRHRAEHADARHAQRAHDDARQHHAAHAGQHALL